MIKQKDTILTVHKDNYDDRICLRIEDDEQVGGTLNVIWMTEKETEKLIGELQKKVEELKRKRQRFDEIIRTTNFNSLYSEFERRYNKYPVQMSCCEAFGRAYNDGLIDKDTYYAAQKFYNRLWNYVGD